MITLNFLLLKHKKIAPMTTLPNIPNVFKEMELKSICPLNIDKTAFKNSSQYTQKLESGMLAKFIKG